MQAVGIRELKSRLSEYVRLARSGEPVLVTDRGRVVAELHPPGAAAARAGGADPLAELARRGLATPGAPHDAALYAPRPPVLRGSGVRELLAAERAEGAEGAEGEAGDGAGDGAGDEAAAGDAGE